MEEPDDTDWTALAEQHKRDEKQRQWQQEKQQIFLLLMFFVSLLGVIALVGPLMPTL